MNSVASDLYRRTGVFADDAPHVPVKGARAPGPGADFVRMIACGSVDDGKSTLIGRLLHEAGRVPDDERAALARASASHGTRGGDIDYALLLDGLDAEREQGITIDVAWRHLETKRRRFLIADCPGHVQYTRNMATGASVADLAVVLVDATRGLLPQTFRHAAILALFGVRHVLLAVNKMDRVGYDQAVFDDIATRFGAHAGKLGLPDVVAVPVAAAVGDNVTTRSPAMPWYRGPSVLEHLETVAIDRDDASGPLRLPVQSVLRDADGGRWLAGTVASGTLRAGEDVSIEPSGTRSRVAAIRVSGVERAQAVAGQAVTVRLADEVDAGRGHVLAAADAPLAHSDQVQADVLWFDEAPLLPGRRYQVKLGTGTVGVRVSELKHRHDPDSLQPLAAKRLEFNEIGGVVLSLDSPVAFAPYAESAALGGFILVDPISRATVGAGMIRHGLRRADNIHWQALDVDRKARAALKGQRPRCVWFTGLSGAGKSTIANLVERGLLARGLHTYLLDGDNVRHGLNRDLGFTDEDRVENLRRVSEVAKLMTDAGLIVLVSFISPFRAERRAARALFDEGDFIEVYVNTPLEEAERRDVKGLYAKARRGELPNFTGIDSPYEPPESPELVLDTTAADPAVLAEQVIARLLD
ncbi:adenylyl-sulfate kinase [Luteimonas wenzhouensis]|jgi:bifunctional enzyme CysN/CysC|uniref:Adenylyl-sulfate kinase n=1 Tax=Luteimonas wenzhouensis TaxID=2599615 RepID=A0A5C5TVV5_9GAMM|nr:adenylyl-sulfate kinase [Luteimonas wenzhouensis]TWT17619.1 adenylyl-sulfate kinase [Luteimonas wenzhouensis]